MPAFTWNLLIGKEILQLDSRQHPNRVETVSRSPVPNQNPIAYSIGIEPFAIELPGGVFRAALPSYLP